MNKLESWYKEIEKFDKLTLEEAKSLLIEAYAVEEESLKKIYMDKVILGTLYVVYNNIKANSLWLLVNATFDMDDIISTFTELWIKAIKSGKLFEVNSMSEIFTRSFYTDFAAALSVNDYIIGIETCLNSVNFKDYFQRYLSLKRKNDKVSVDEFLKFIDDDYLSGIDLCDVNKVFILFENIYNSFNFLDDEECNLSKTKIDYLKQVFIGNALEVPLSDSILVEYDDLIINQCYIDDIMEEINNIPLSDSQRKILDLRFGFLDDCKTLRETADILGMHYSKVDRDEHSILRKLRFSRKVQKAYKV